MVIYYPLLKMQKKRIIIAKPAYKQGEVETILDMRKNNHVKCKVYLEVGDTSLSETV